MKSNRSTIIIIIGMLCILLLSPDISFSKQWNGQEGVSIDAVTMATNPDFEPTTTSSSTTTILITTTSSSMTTSVIPETTTSSSTSSTTTTILVTTTTTTTAPAGPCPFENTLTNSDDLKTLRLLRDTRLKNNVFGLSLVYTYYKHAAEAALILDENPDLQDRLQELVNTHMGRARDFIAGSEITFSRVDTKEIADFMEQLKATGSLKFQRDMDVVIKSLLDGSLLSEIGINVN